MTTTVFELSESQIPNSPHMQKRGCFMASVVARLLSDGAIYNQKFSNIRPASIQKFKVHI